MLETISIQLREGLIKIIQALRTLPPVSRVIVLVSVVGLIPGYFVARTISQAYWGHRYHSLEVQARPSFTNPRVPTVSPVAVLPLGGDAYAAYAEVTNENFELSAEGISYTVKFMTPRGEVAHSTSGRLFLLPAKKSVIAVSRFETSEPIASAAVVLGDIHWQKRLSIPQVTVSSIRPDPRLAPQRTPFTVEAAVRNDSPYQLKSVEIIIVAYDSQNQVVAVSARQESTVNPSEVRKFPVLWPSTDGSDVVRIDVIPQTNVLDAGNLLLMQNRTGGPDLRRPSGTN